MSAKLIFPGLCGIISLLFSACPLYIPEKVQIKTEPAIYLPLGTPDSLQDHMDFSINDLAEVTPDFSDDEGFGEIALHDFQGEYGDTRALIIRMKLVEVDLGTVFDELPVLPGGEGGEEIPDDLIPDGTPTDIKIDFTDYEEINNSLLGTCPDIDLKQIVDILNRYKGLKFRSIPVYFYIQGPNRIFENENVTVNLEVQPEIKLLYEQLVSPCELPNFPKSGDAMTEKLSPKPGTSFDLKDILNQDDPPTSLVFEYEIKVGPIMVKYDELSAIKEEFETPLSATMVLVLPFQFSVSQDIPILSEQNVEEDAKAIHLFDEGEDIFGRTSADESGSSVTELLDRMQSLVIHVNIENNLGLSGYAPVYSAKPNPDNIEENQLGKIRLSGLSSLSIPKTGFNYPFNIWLEMYLGEGQEFDIKRPSKDPEILPLKLSLTVIVKTQINETF